MDGICPYCSRHINLEQSKELYEKNRGKKEVITHNYIVIFKYYKDPETIESAYSLKDAFETLYWKVLPKTIVRFNVPNVSFEGDIKKLKEWIETTDFDDENKFFYGYNSHIDIEDTNCESDIYHIQIRMV